MSVVDAVARIGGIEQRITALRRPPTPGRFEQVLREAVADPEPAGRAGGSLGGSQPTRGGVESIGMLGTQVSTLAGWGGLRVPSEVAATPPPSPPRRDGELVELLPEHGRSWVEPIESAATEFGVDPRFLAAVVWTESSFAPDAVSRSGALGLSQLMPGTAAELGVDPHDPVDNLRGGAKYLRRLLDEFGRVDLAAAAYNAGPGRVRENGGFPYVADPGGYVQSVVTHYRQLGGTHP